MRLPIGRPIRWTGVLAVGCGLALLGCGASKTARPPGQGAARIVVAPVNLALRLPPEFEDAVDPVRNEMIRYLQRRDARVAVIWPSDAWNLWRDSMAAVEGSGPAGQRLDEAAGRFVRELTNHTDFQFFVLPSLVYRGARVRGRTARWDGVERRVTPLGAPAAGAVLEAPGSEAGDLLWSGEIPAVSLHVLVFTPDGQRVYEGWGGLVLTHTPTVSRRWRSRGSSVALKRQFFADREPLSEGIAVALDPYVGDAVP